MDIWKQYVWWLWTLCGIFFFLCSVLCVLDSVSPEVFLQWMDVASLGWLQLLPLTHLQRVLSSAPDKILWSFLHSLPDCFQSSAWYSWLNNSDSDSFWFCPSSLLHLCYKTNAVSQFRVTSFFQMQITNEAFFSLFLRMLLSFVDSHIPRFFTRPKKKKEKEKTATLHGVDRHFHGPGWQKSWRKGKTSGDATRKCSKG